VPFICSSDLDESAFAVRTDEVMKVNSNGCPSESESHTDDTWLSELAIYPHMKDFTILCNGDVRNRSNPIDISESTFNHFEVIFDLEDYTKKFRTDEEREAFGEAMQTPVFKYWLIGRDDFWAVGCEENWTNCSDQIVRLVLLDNYVFWDDALNIEELREALAKEWMVFSMNRDDAVESVKSYLVEFAEDKPLMLRERIEDPK
jgi:hypothetical protein